MTAGKGIVHSERSSAQARAAVARVHGIQTWVALPQAHEETEPDFHHHGAKQLPVMADGAVEMRLILGSAYGLRSPVRTFSETCYLAVDSPAGARIALPREHEELALYVVSGELTAGEAPIPAHHLALLPSGRVEVRTGAPSRFMVIGGARIEGQRYIWWNFVSSSRERIEQAREDWRAERFAPIPGESERIELPER